MKNLVRSSSLLSLMCLAGCGLALAAGTAPPNGFTNVAVSSNADDVHPNYGVDTRLVLDANGDPAVCFLWADPNGDNDYSDTTLYFTGWSRTQGKFLAPVKVAVTGDIATQDAEVGISLARDASNNMFGIAYRVEPTSGDTVVIHLALSTDGGATWKDEVVESKTGDGDFRTPTLALANGNAYLAYISDGHGVKYITGKETDPPANWTSQLAPVDTGYSAYENVASLALDSNGVPGIAYILDSDSANDQRLKFWRPGSTTASLISGPGVDKEDQNDIHLAFFGTKASVVFHGALDTNYFVGNGHTVWAIRSNDGGNTWGPPVNVPPDNGSSMDVPLGFAVGSQGQGAIASYSNGSDGSDVCEQPKLSLSDNNFANWKTCAPETKEEGKKNFYAYTPSVAYGPNDRLYVVFQVPPKMDLSYGVQLWSQPLAGGSGPVVNTGGIVNGASFTPGAPVSPGELASIYGTGFAPAAIGADVIPLPTNLNGLSVTVNGELAPLVYANPTQINFQIPWDVPAGSANFAVINGSQSNTVQAQVVPASPGIFMYNGNRAVVQDGSYLLVDQSNPAKPGSTVIVYMTGSGPVKPGEESGVPAVAAPLSYVQDSISATLGTTPAHVSFAGLSPGFVGLLQVNVDIPAGLAAGDYPLTVTINKVPSNSPLIVVGQ